MKDKQNNTIIGLIAVLVIFLVCKFPYEPTRFIPPAAKFKFITATEIKNIVGTQNVKVVFVADKRETIYFYDFNDTLPVQKLKRPAGKSGFLDSPLLSPDGKWVVYFLIADRSTYESYVQKLDPNSEPILISKNATDPHWWVNGVDGSINVIYSDMNLVDLNTLKSLQGYYTYMKKLTFTGDHVQVPATAEIIADKPMNGGRSADGRYLCTAYSDAAFYDITATGNKLIPINEGVQTCNPSICPDPAKSDWMMFLNINGQQNMKMDTALGNIESHYYVFIVDASNTVRWMMLRPEGNGETREWQDPEWSNHPDFFSALGGNPNADNPQYDAYVVQISAKKAYKLLADDSPNKMDPTSTPYIWIGK